MSVLSNNNNSLDSNVPDELTTKTLDDEFDRKKRYINSCKFDDATLRRRDNELKELQKLYPNMCLSFLELAWNFTNFTSQEEQDRIIKNKLWEGKPEKVRVMGGVIKNAMTIETRESRDD